MRVIDEPLLKSLRIPGYCEYCGTYCQRGRVPHHLLCKGMGSGRRIDAPQNLISLGTAFDCMCHENAQRNRPGFERHDMSEIVGRRLGKTGQQCIDEVDAIRAR